MAQPISAAMGAKLDLPDGYVVEWAAIDPATGADVAGVVVSGVSIFGTMLGLGSGGTTLPEGPWYLKPPPPPPPPVTSPPPTLADVVQLIQDIEAKLNQALTDLGETTPNLSGALTLLQSAQTELGTAITDVQQLIGSGGGGSSTGWTTVVSADFSTWSDGQALPFGWCRYRGKGTVFNQGYYDPNHIYVKGGLLHVLSAYNANGPNGAAWYTGAMAIHGAVCGSPAPTPPNAFPFSSVNGRLTIRMRLVENGTATMGHRNILFWPDAAGPGGYYIYGEEDMWESQQSDTKRQPLSPLRQQTAVRLRSPGRTRPPTTGRSGTRSASST
jgi:hypothetical protein